MFLTYALYAPKIFIFSSIYNVSSGIKYISSNIGCCVSNFSALAAAWSSSLSGFSNTQQGVNSMIPVKSSENPLSRITAIVAGLFIINTLLLSGLYSKDVHKKSIAEKIILEKKQESEPTSVPFEN